MTGIARSVDFDRTVIRERLRFTGSDLYDRPVHTSAAARATAFWLAVTAMALTACGGDGPSGSAIAIDDFPAAYQAATCEVWTGCGLSPDVATCNATVSAASFVEVATLVAAVKRGTIRYDSVATRACLDGFDSGCGSATPPAACEQALQGQLAAGSACVNSTECAAAGYCDKEQCPGNTCCAGTCVARVPAGGSCAGGGRCAAGTFCHEGVCTENLPLGASCTAVGGCEPPGFCEIPAGATTGTCALWDAAGSRCDPARFSPCGRIDERCDPTSNRCVKVGGVGAPCAVMGDCARYARCVQGVCTAAPTAGGACTADVERSCQGTLTCTNETCVAPAALPACVPPAN